MAQWVRFAAGLLVLFGLAGCVIPLGNLGELAPVPAVTPEVINPHLEAALAYSPVKTESIAFTDWAKLKEIGGVPALTSEDSMDERVDFMRGLGVEQQAVATAFANRFFFIHAEEWGWDSTDLRWEAMFSVENAPPVYLLRFRDDFDFAPVLERFEERGFTQTTMDEATLYSHAMDLSRQWLRTTEFAILNTAFLKDEKLFVLSSSADGVATVLDGLADHASLANLSTVRSVAAALGEVGAAILLPMGCQPLDVASLFIQRTPEEIEEALAELRQSGITGLYTTFGLGYRTGAIAGEQAPLGVVVLHYLDPEQAVADLAPRRDLAETGSSLINAVPYADLFEVVEARVEGTNQIFSLRARERTPQLFFNMFYKRDLLFTVCGGF
jgi:hypothetical protein